MTRDILRLFPRRCALISFALILLGAQWNNAGFSLASPILVAGAPADRLDRSEGVDGTSSVPLTGEPPQGSSQITVNWMDLHQVIDGFGASSAWLSTISDAQANMFFSATSGIGLSLLRNHINPDGTTGELATMQKAYARGAKIWSAPWTPPAAWKDNNSLINGGHLLAARYQDYANQLANYVSNMKSSGVPLHAISIQNEPDWVASWESCIWTAQELHDFVPYLHAALAAKGVANTLILMPEDTDWRISLLADATMADPTTAAMVGILGAHNYDGGQGTAQTTYGKKLWETEVCTGDAFDGSMTNAMMWAQKIYSFLTTAEVNAWHYWWLIDPNGNNGGLTDQYGNPAKRMYVVGNFSKFVRPGWYRIGTTDGNGILISAYKDPSTGQFAVVAINTNASSTSATMNLVGFSATSVTPWITSSSLSLAQQSAVAVAGSSFTYTLPAQSVTTFVGQGGAGDTTPPTLSQISASSITATGAAVTWTTDEASDSQIEYGTTTSYGSSTTLDSTLVTAHPQTLSGLAPSTLYHYRVKSKDASGNLATSGDYTFTTLGLPDTTPPSVSITSPTSASTYSTGSSTVNLGGSASDNVGVTQLTWANNRGGSGTASGTTSWTVSGITLQSGANVLTVTATDAANNSATATLTVTYTPPDTTPPTVTVTTPTSGSTYSTGSSTVNLGGTASDNVGVTQVTWANSRGGSGTASGTTSWTVSGITLQSGANVLTVTARDAANNSATATLTVTYTPPDTTPPSVTITTPTTGSTYSTGSSTVNLGGTASDNVGVTQVTWANSRGGGGTASGTTSWTVSGITLQSGANVLTVTATDAANNSATATLTVTYTPPDTTPPSVTITTPTSASTYSTGSSTVNLGGSASDNVGVTQLTWANNRGGSGTASGTTSWTVSGITLQSGSNVLTVTATDAANNSATATLTVTYTPPDTTPPTVTVTTPTSGSTYSTGSSTVNLGGTASDNVGVTQVTWANSRGGSGTASGTTSWTVSGITLQSGANVLTVTARDAANNSATATLTVTYTPPDTTPPTVTITSPTSSSTYSTGSSTVNLGGSASDNVGVTQVTWANNRGGSGTASGTTSWTVSGITLQSGANVLTVTATDAANNSATATLTVTYTPPDTTPPTVTVTTPTSGSTYSTASSTVNLGGSASDNVGVTQVTWANSRGGSGTASGTTSWTVSGITLQSGANVLTVTATDTANNAGTATLTVTYTPPDTTPPAVTITSPTSGSTYSTGSSMVNLGGSASDNVGVTQVTWANNRGGSGTASGTTSWTVSGITLQSGANVLTVTATDAANNSATATLTVTYTPPDATPPSVTITTPTTGSTYSTGSSTVNLGGTASDNVGVTQVTWANSRGGSGTASGTTSWTVSGITLQSGANVLTVTATDAANNSATATLTVTYTPPDTTPPSVTITTPTTGSTYSTGSSTVNLGGTASDNVGVTQVTWANSRGGSGTASGTTSWTVSGITLQSGANVLTVTATDTANNAGTATLTVTYTPPDATPPTVTVTTPTSSSTYSTGSSTVNLGGSASDNVGVTQVTWANNRGGSGTASGTTSWTVSGITLQSGANVLTVTARDAANNSATATLTVTYTPPDTTPPTVIVTTPTSGSTYSTASSTVNLGGSASDNVGVTQVTWANNRGGSGTASGTTSWTVSGITLQSGANVLTVTATDAANNSATATLTVTYTPPDTTPPSVTIMTPTTGSTYSTGSSTVNLGGTASDNVGVTQVTWANSRGGGGTASGTTSWTVSGITLQSGANVLTVTATDAANNSATATLTVTYTPPDTTPPTVTITSPTSGSTYSTGSSTVNLGGTASDNVGVTQVTWANSRGGGGTASGTTSWTVSGITLQSGTNVLTVTATDAANNSATATLTVTYTAPCSYTLTPSIVSVSSAATTGTISVEAPAGCGWTVSWNAGWITITSASSGSGNGTASYSLAANTIPVARTGNIAVSDRTFTINQGALGDINGDGFVNVLDLQILVNVILGESNASSACDLNRDGLINVIDLQLLINLILGI